MKSLLKSQKNNFIFFCFIFSLLFSCLARSEISVTDDNNKLIKLASPATRVISLSPHLTELLFAAGAAKQIVGVVRYSDFPGEAKQISRVGDTYRLDMEKILSLEPDLILAWQSGNNPADISLLESLNFKIFVSEPASLDDIAVNLEKIGKLTGNEEMAFESSKDYRFKLASLRSQFSEKNKIKTFYQFWHSPIFTINGNHLISEIINLCGGKNVFADLKILSTQVGLESVILANPDIIIASGIDANRPEWLNEWNKWKTIEAVRHEHLYHIPPDYIQRHTPRILQGAELMCELIDTARNKP